jgi:hypothetical protein
MPEPGHSRRFRRQRRDIAVPHPPPRVWPWNGQRRHRARLPNRTGRSRVARRSVPTVLAGNWAEKRVFRRHCSGSRLSQAGATLLRSAATGSSGRAEKSPPRSVSSAAGWPKRFGKKGDMVHGSPRHSWHQLAAEGKLTTAGWPPRKGAKRRARTGTHTVRKSTLWTPQVRRWLV